jgi:hypothetical protein
MQSMIGLAATGDISMPKKAALKAAASGSKSSSEKRERISQSDIPAYSLGEALKIPAAIADNYNLKPTTTLNVASALEVQPNTGPFRMVTGGRHRLWPDLWRHFFHAD